MRVLRFPAWVLVTLVSASCGKGPPEHKEQASQQRPEVEKPSTAPAATPSPPVNAAPGGDSGAVVELQIASVGDTMTFDKTKLSVPTGSRVHLVLKNNSKLEILPHNWVLVNTGTEAAVAATGLALGVDAGYIAAGQNVLAFTPLAARGQTTEVTFVAPPAGAYPYVCTVPGHYVMMKGVLTVTP